MPAPANRNDPPLPTEPSRISWRREYRDSLDRPMTGSVVFYVAARGDIDGRITAMSPVRIPIVDGVAEAVLPQGEYTVAEQLVNAEGVEMPYGGSYTLVIA